MSEIWYSEFIPYDRRHSRRAADGSPSSDDGDCRNAMGALLADVLSSAEFTVRQDGRHRSFVRFRLQQDAWERARPAAGEGAS